MARPDFEAPADGNSNNIYEVTIVADDGRNTAELTADVTVKVTNAEEDGEVTLSYQQPLIGRELTASVTDPDGGFDPANGAPRTDVTAVTWQWERTVGTYEPLTDQCLEDNNIQWESAGGRMAIYKPGADDDRKCLRATATYIDRTYMYPHEPPIPDPDTVDGDDGFIGTALVISGVVPGRPGEYASQVRRRGREIRAGEYAWAQVRRRSGYGD